MKNAKQMQMLWKYRVGKFSAESESITENTQNIKYVLCRVTSLNCLKIQEFRKLTLKILQNANFSQRLTIYILVLYNFGLYILICEA